MNALRSPIDVPPTDRILETLRMVGEQLGLPRCYAFRRAFHFALGDGWSIAITPEPANRFRIDACRWSRPAATFWIFDGEHDRLAAIVARFALHVAHATHDQSGDANASFREARGSLPMH